MFDKYSLLKKKHMQFGRIWKNTRYVIFLTNKSQSLKCCTSLTQLSHHFKNSVFDKFLNILKSWFINLWIRVFIVSSFISLYNFDHFFLKTLVTYHKGPIERMTLHISHDLLTAMDVK